jgi:integrase
VTRLTKRALDALKPLQKKDVFVWDGEIRGLGVRLKPSGTRTFFIQYRNYVRRTRRFVIGQYGVLTVEQARSLAREHLAAVVKGEDPSAERKAIQRACTVQDLCRWYLKEAESGRLLGRRRRPIKASTLAMDRSRINTHIVPLLGTRQVSGLTRADIDRMQADIASGKTSKPRIGRGGNTTGGPGVAGRSVSTLHAIFEHGIRLGMIDANPARGVRKLAEQRRDRRLSEREIMRLGRALLDAEAQGENATGIAAIKFILLTGFRRMEALALEPAWLDPGIRSVNFPDTKGGKQTRIIGKAARQLIKASHSQNNPRFIFPADIGGGHFIGAPRVLDRVIGRAGLSDITIHTLRHTFASIGGELGFSELTLAGLLGHASRGVTQRYIHLDEALIVAADRISERIALLLDMGKDEALGTPKIVKERVAAPTNRMVTTMP